MKKSTLNQEDAKVINNIMEDQLRKKGLVTDDALNKKLLTLGIDVSKPIESQEDFRFLRQFRINTGLVKIRTIITAFSIIMAGILALMWIAVTGQFND